jgi:glutamine amidotransferase
MPEVSIIDYGCGNLLSVARALEQAGARAVFASSSRDIDRARHLVLPGVGAFEEGMKGLIERKLPEAIRNYAFSGSCFQSNSFIRLSVPEHA